MRCVCAVRFPVVFRCGGRSPASGHEEEGRCSRGVGAGRSRWGCCWRRGSPRAGPGQWQCPAIAEGRRVPGGGVRPQCRRWRRRSARLPGPGMCGCRESAAGRREREPEPAHGFLQVVRGGSSRAARTSWGSSWLAARCPKWSGSAGGGLGHDAVADVFAGAEGRGEGRQVHGLQHRADAPAPAVDAGRRDLREFLAYCFQQAPQGLAGRVDSWLLQDAQGHGDRDGRVRGSGRAMNPGRSMACPVCGETASVLR